MADPQRSPEIEQARKSVERLHDCDPLALARVVDLGPTFNFQLAVGPAERLVNLGDLLSR